MAAQLYLTPSLETALLHTVERIGETRRSHPLLPARILVPTGQTGQAVRQHLGDALGVHLYQFYGLGQAILEDAGHPLRGLNDTTIRRLVEYLLAQMNAQSELSTFSAVGDKPGFTQVLVDWLREMKTQAISPEDLAALARETGLERDRQLSTLYTRYQRFLQREDLSDSDGLLWLAAEALEQDPDLFKNQEPFFMLGFDQFSPVHERIIRALSGRFAGFSIYLPWDEHRPETSLALTRLAETRARLRAILPDLVEFKLAERGQAAPGLVHLSRTLFEPEASQFVPAAEPPVRTYAAPSREIEVRLALREIKRLLLRDIPPGEIVLLAPHAEIYARTAELVAEEYGIPIRLEGSLAANPAVQALLNLMALPPDFPWRETLETLRSPYIRQPWLTAEQVNQLERLSRERPVIQGREQWLFALEPLPAVRSEEDEELDLRHSAGQFTAEELNAIQAGLTAFFDHLTPPPAASHREYTLWLQERILGLAPPLEDEADEPEPLPATLDLAKCAAEGTFAERDLRALSGVLRQLRALVDAAELVLPGDGNIVTWPIYHKDLLNALPRLYSASGEQTSAVRFARLEAGRERPVDYMFILGLSEGEFPSAPAPDPLYAPAERQHYPLPLQNPHPAQDASLFWLVVSSCRRGLWLFRPRLDDSGAPWQPSPFWEAVLEKISAPLVEVPVAFVPAVEEAAGPAELMVALAMDRAASAPPELADAWQAASHTWHVMSLRGAWAPAEVFEGRLLAPDLQGELAARYSPDSTWSASRLNRYGACPFGFFAQVVLELEEMPDPEEGLDAMQRGSLLHEILERLHRRITADGLALAPVHQAAILARLDTTCDEQFRRAPARYAFRPTPLWSHEQGELRRLLRALVAWECAQVTPYRPYQQELRFGLGDSPLPRYRFVDSQGTSIYLHGVIDRIDRDETSGTLRVVDYKSGSTTYSIADITSGHALQAPLYALAAEGLLGEQVVESAYLLIPRREFSGRLSAPAGAAANENIQAALDQAGSFVRDIRQGAFPSLPAKPAAGSLACSAYCEFTSLCRVNRQALAKARRAAG